MYDLSNNRICLEPFSCLSFRPRLKELLTIVIFLGFSLFSLFPSGCGQHSNQQKTGEGGSQVSRNQGSQNVKSLVWPEPPETPRIRYVGKISELKDVGIGKWRKFINFLIGSEKNWLIRPMDVAVMEGIIYLADPGAQAFYIINTAGKSFKKITKSGKSYLNSPLGVAISKSKIYISGSHLNKIIVYSKNGEFIKTLGEGELRRPTGLAYDENSQLLYISDTLNNRILIYDRKDKLVGSFGKRGERNGEFNYPTYLWVDREGLLYVSDTLNFRIQIFDKHGNFISKFGILGDGSGNFARPKGVATDSFGHIYVVDALFDAIQIFDRQGTLLLTFGRRGVKPGEFWLPTGIFIDEKNKIYITDSYNQRIQLFEFISNHEKTL